MRKPKILILGGTSRLAGMLRRAWGTTPPGQMLWQTRGPAPGPDWISLDPLSEPERLTQCARDASAILDLSGRVRDNFGLNTALARATLSVAPPGARVFLASSAAVYGPSDTPLAEDSSPAPTSPYGASKAAMEALAASPPTDTQVTCLRIGNIAGADALLSAQPPIQLDRFADGSTPERSYLGPASFTEVLTSLLTHPGPLPGLLNVAAPESVTMQALLDSCGREWTPRPAAESARPRVVLDVTRLAQIHPFRGGEGGAAQVIREWEADRP